MATALNQNLNQCLCGNVMSQVHFVVIAAAEVDTYMQALVP